MKKYLPIVAIVVFIMGLLSFTEYIMEQQKAEAAQEAYEEQRHIVVYSTLPADINSALEKAFYEDTHWRVSLQTQEDQLVKQSIAVPNQHADVVISSEPVLRTLAKQHVLKPYESAATATVASRFKDSQYKWTGLWFNPMVFVVSQDYYVREGLHFSRWDDLLTDPLLRVVAPDLASMDMAGDFLCSFVEMRGKEQTELYLKTLQSHVILYSKTMSPIVRRVASGDADVGIVDAVTARQYRQDGVPIYILYPADGTAYWLNGAAVTTASTDEEITGAFMEWLFSKRVDTLLRQHHLYFSHTSIDGPQIVDDRGQQVQLFPVQKNYTVQGRKELQDWWIKAVRFGKEL